MRRSTRARASLRSGSSRQASVRASSSARSRASRTCHWWRPRTIPAAARQLVPGAARDRSALPSHRCAGHQVHDVVAAKAAFGEIEEAQQCPACEARRQGGDAGAVGRYAGGIEVITQQAGVGLGRRVDDGHLVEGDTRPGRVDDTTDGVAYLVVGIGHAGDGDRRRWRRVVGGGELDAESSESPVDETVCGAVAAATCDDGDGRGLAQAAHQLGTAR